MAQIIRRDEQIVHIRFEGRSWDVPASAIGLGVDSNEDAVKRAVARYLEVGVERLGLYVVEFHENGAVTIRPEAVFG